MQDEDTLTFDRWFRRRRKLLDLTQEQLAKRASCSVETIRKIEAGERRPSQQIAETLAMALEIAPDELALFVHIARMAPGSSQAALLQALAPPNPLPPEQPRPHANAQRKTVAFLMSCIQKSAALWERHPKAMRAAYARYINILSARAAAHGGSALKMLDTTPYATFTTVVDAISAAAEIQRAVAAASWDKLGALPVGIAIHVGTVDEQQGGSQGQTLHRLIELCNAGHPGQVLLSLPAQQLALDDLADGIILGDLGAHHIAGSAREEQIFQLIAPGLPTSFPSLKTPNAPRTNLPAQSTDLIGRAREVSAICAILRRENVQILTLTGIGGIGKTRLALRVAAELAGDFRQSVMFVPLATLSDPALVLPTIAQTLGVEQGQAGSLIQDLVSHLRDQQTLLVLDNFEHVLEAAPALGELLAGAPRLKLLVTSRARLNLYSERLFTVLPLSLIDRSAERQPAVEQVIQSDAVQLFVQRVHMIQPDFTLDAQNAPIILDICAYLDGIPLAIELAAARMQLLPPQALLRRLHDRFALLTNGASDLPARQRTLRSALDWSYNLLDKHEQLLFRRLAVFAGGCTVEAIGKVVVEQQLVDSDAAALDTATSLLHKSLIEQTSRDGEPWFTMLETIRAYALDRLTEHGEAERAWYRCAEYYRSYLEQIEEELSGSNQQVHLAALAREHDNLRAVLTWALEEPAEDSTRMEIALRLCGVLWRFWWVRGYLYEGRRWLARATAGRSNLRPELRAPALYGAGVLARTQGDLAAAAALLGESLALWKALDHKPGIARTLNSLGVLLFNQREYDRAAAFFEENAILQRELNDTGRVAVALNNLGNIAYKRGDLEHATKLYEEGLGLLTGDFANRQTIALIKSNLGEVARIRKDHIRAATFLHESAAIYCEFDDAVGILFCLENLTDLALDCLHGELAARLLGAADRLYNNIGAVRSPEQALDYDRQIAAVHSLIHDPAFTAAWSSGRATTLARLLDQATDEVMLKALQKGEDHAGGQSHAARGDQQ